VCRPKFRRYALFVGGSDIMIGLLCNKYDTILGKSGDLRKTTVLTDTRVASDMTRRVPTKDRFDAPYANDLDNTLAARLSRNFHRGFRLCSNPPVNCGGESCGFGKMVRSTGQYVPMTRRDSNGIPPASIIQSAIVFYLS
jgi:hypothetical protein